MFKTNCAYADADCATRGGARENRSGEDVRSVRSVGKGKKGTNLRLPDEDLRPGRIHWRTNRKISDFDIINDALRNFDDNVIRILMG